MSTRASSTRLSSPKSAPLIEFLEPRQLLAIDVPENVNVSRLPDNQAEGAITIDRANPDRMFAFSNMGLDDAMMAAWSDDGGRSWHSRVIATGADGLVAACCDPTASFDQFGNLYAAYLNADRDAIVVIRSTDGGRTFGRIASFRGNVDQPTITAVDNALWVTFEQNGRIVAAGAKITGLGRLGRFSPTQLARGSLGGNFGDIAVGPDGQVMVTYMTPTHTPGPSSIYVNIDPDGLGPRVFSRAIRVTDTGVGGFHFIRAQPHVGIDAEPAIAYDRSAGPFRGRVYLVYTDKSKKRYDSNIFYRHSPDDGRSWSERLRLNTDTSFNSQFFPRVAVDSASGDVAFSWHDSRLDLGRGSMGSTNARRNDDADLFARAGKPYIGGLLLSEDFRVSAGTSNAERSNNSIDLGDYTGLDFHAGTFFPIWADNSNSTRDNPDGRLRELDIYTASVPMAGIGAADDVLSAIIRRAWTTPRSG